jgi:hypothetical protein
MEVNEWLEASVSTEGKTKRERIRVPRKNFF